MPFVFFVRKILNHETDSAKHFTPKQPLVHFSAIDDHTSDVWAREVGIVEYERNPAIVNPAILANCFFVDRVFSTISG